MARLVHNYLATHLPETLTLRTDLTNKARADAAAAVKPAMVSLRPNLWSDCSDRQGPLRERDRIAPRRACGLYAAAFLAAASAAIGRFRWFDHSALPIVRLLYFSILDRSLINETVNVIRLLGLCVGCIVIAVLASQDPLRSEVAPVTLSAIIATLVSVGHGSDAHGSLVVVDIL